jgi:formylglycine-generating enzyme required for sulfatase activity
LLPCSSPPPLGSGAEQKDLLRACLVENPALDLSPFLAVLDGEPSPGTQALVLELMTGRTDPELLERARTLAESADELVAQRAQRLLQRQAPAAAEEGWDLLLLHAPEDQDAAARLAVELRGAGLRPWLAVERLTAGRAWQDTRVLQELLELALPVLVLAQAGRPWEDLETLDALQLFAERDIPLLGAGRAAGAPTDLLPPTAWLPDDRRLPQVLAARLERQIETQLEASRPEPRIEANLVAGPQSGEPYTEPHTGIRLLWIPGGTFDMGSDQIGKKEKPIHRVRISPFRLAETPVTNRQYGLFLEANEHQEPALWRDRRFSDPEQPVVGVSWDDAQAFCAWLAEKRGLALTLPSEAQWEFAARGQDGRIYPWGNEPPNQERACYDQDWEKGKPDPVGSHPAGRGPFGTLDQAGSVCEWCLDAWDDQAYRKRAAEEPLDPVVTSGDRERSVLRGGGWLSPADLLPAACRNRFPARLRFGYVGFRVAVAPAGLGS